mgnify:CR=1 FL=1
MARPKKHDHERRDASTRTDLTLAEKAKLGELVRDSGLRSEAEFVREAIFSATIRPPARSSGADPALISELNRIGVNVNQLAASVHMDRDFVQYWREIGVELQRVLEKVLADGS